MMRKIKTITLMLCVAMFFVSFAMMVTQALSHVDNTKNVSLELTYNYGDMKFSSLDVKIYKVCEMSGNVTFTLTGAFKGLPVDVQHVKSQSEWRQIATTFASYVVAEDIKPTASGVTDENGVVSFKDLPVGLYLVEGKRVDTEKGYCTFDPFVITLPGVNEDETWNYDVSAKPKSVYTDTVPKDVEYTVKKLWKDNGNANRPKSVEIELYKDGEFAERVFLSSENNWSYSWISPEDAVWFVIEVNIAEEYTMAIDRKGNTYYVTNTIYVPPSTGDSINLYIPIAVLSVAGVIFLLVGCRKPKEICEE